MIAIFGCIIASQGQWFAIKFFTWLRYNRKYGHFIGTSIFLYFFAKMVKIFRCFEYWYFDVLRVGFAEPDAICSLQWVLGGWNGILSQRQILNTNDDKRWLPQCWLYHRRAGLLKPQRKTRLISHADMGATIQELTQSIYVLLKFFGWCILEKSLHNLNFN